MFYFVNQCFIAIGYLLGLCILILAQTCIHSEWLIGLLMFCRTARGYAPGDAERRLKDSSFRGCHMGQFWLFAEAGKIELQGIRQRGISCCADHIFSKYAYIPVTDIHPYHK